MKFGKLLQSTALDLPEQNNLVLRYKQLKKQLKVIQSAPGISEKPAAPDNAEGTSKTSTLSEQEKKFIETLNEDLAGFNQFFMDKEEDSVIRLQVLTEQMQGTLSPEESRQLVTQLVDFHGEMVLLLHWSFLNYAAVLKILKKHDKHTGLFLRAPYVATLLQQPFFSTRVLTRLVKQAESHIQLLVKSLDLPDQNLCEIPATSEPTADDGELLRRTKAALEVWRQLSDTASTPSTVLPSEVLKKYASSQEVQHLLERHLSQPDAMQPTQGLAKEKRHGVESDRSSPAAKKQKIEES